MKFRYQGYGVIKYNIVDCCVSFSDDSLCLCDSLLMFIHNSNICNGLTCANIFIVIPYVPLKLPQNQSNWTIYTYSSIVHVDSPPRPMMATTCTQMISLDHR